MITVYEIKSNGFLGVSKQIDPREGVTSNWTYTPPPGDGLHKWENGKWVPYSVEPELNFAVGLDLNALADEIRTLRDQRLTETDWTQGKDIPDEISQLWVQYRQQLRDVPSQVGFPTDVEWPTKPTE